MSRRSHMKKERYFSVISLGRPNTSPDSSSSPRAPCPQTSKIHQAKIPRHLFCRFRSPHRQPISTQPPGFGNSNQKLRSTGMDDSSSLNFVEFPEDVQFCILSFLTLPDIFTFACTSTRFASLIRSDTNLWHAMCDRRWGSKTQITKWGAGRVPYKLLYRTLNEWDDLIGFWRRSGQGSGNGIELPGLVFFEWGVSYLSGFRVSSGRDGSYGVVKAPFLMMGLGENGEVVNLLDPEGRSEYTEPGVELDIGKLGFADSDLISVNVSFMGRNHLVVEEASRFISSNSVNKKMNGMSRSSSSGSMKLEEEDMGMIGGDGGFVGSPGSFPDRLMLDIYQYFANRTSPVSDRSTRRQRRREKERRKWGAEHFIKIVNCSPTPDRPLQGLWKVEFVFLVCMAAF